jgi:gluconate 5-dehydrogenase
MNDLFTIKDKLILVTGSSQGIGRSLAEGYARAGAKVIINGRNQEKIDPVVAGLRQDGYQAEGRAFDVTNKKAAEQAVDGIEQEIGPIDVLVNNAGIQRRAPFEQLSLEDWQAVLDTNLTSVFIISQLVAKRMISRRQGKIINITSLNAEAARPTIANYCAAKGGLKMFTKSLATELGRYNIQANAIGPGYIETELTQKLAADPEFDAWVKNEVPLGRWGKTADLIGAAIFLAAQASDYVNGQTIYVDGGWRASL